MKPSKCEETIVIPVCKQISCNSFKNKITYKIFAHKSDVCKQKTGVKLDCNDYIAILETIT